MQFSLEGKTALVAGGGPWSEDLAIALAEAGADVAVAAPRARQLAAAANLMGNMGRRVLLMAADATRPGPVQRMVERTLAHFGKIDILVNCAGLPFAQPLGEVTDDQWRRVMDTNLTSVFLCSRAVIGSMLERKKGKIINLASGLATRGIPNGTAYCAAQGGVLQFTRALALELARENIQVTAIGPGWITKEAIPQEEALKDPLVRLIPLRRWGRPQDLAGLLVYLASDASNFTSGHIYVVDGGSQAHA